VTVRVLYWIVFDMAQLLTLLGLKLMLFRNSLRSSKAVVSRIASALAMIAALLLSLMLASGLGVIAYFLLSPDFGFHAFTAKGAPSGGREIPTAEFIFFSIFSMLYLIWATVPATMGSSRQFDPGNLLLYPISLRKLFAIDLLSEVATIPAVFAIPSILAMGIGAGLAQKQIVAGVVLAIVAVAFGLAVTKWVSTSTNLLFRRKRARGESLLALIGTVIGLSGVIFAQVAPALFRHIGSLYLLRWTPPGALAFALTHGMVRGSGAVFLLCLLAMIVYTAILLSVTFWLARRAVLGSESRGRRERVVEKTSEAIYTGWNIPFISPRLAAVVEKELRYVQRNAQLRMMAAMPLILIFIRLMNRRRPGDFETDNAFLRDLLSYGNGMMAGGGVLYVFIILTGISCNQFAFEHAGMRTLVLSPVKRSLVLLGKNISTVIVTAVLSVALLVVNHLVFRDLNWQSILFAVLCFLVYAPLMSVMGNWLSIRFPKRMKFGSRFNVSGAVGLLLIPMMVLLLVPPAAAVAAGLITQSLTVEYVTLAILALLSIGLYAAMIEAQGELLERKELSLLEAVNDPSGE
jgi:hypothetical protein